MVVYDTPPVTLRMSRELRDYTRKMSVAFGFASYAVMFDTIFDAMVAQGHIDRMARRRSRGIRLPNAYAGQVIQMAYIVNKGLVERIHEATGSMPGDRVIPGVFLNMIAWLMESQGLIERLDRTDKPCRLDLPGSMTPPPDVVINSLNSMLEATYAAVAGASTPSPVFKISVSGRGSEASVDIDVSSLLSRAGIAPTPDTEPYDVIKAIRWLARPFDV